MQMYTKNPSENIMTNTQTFKIEEEPLGIDFEFIYDEQAGLKLTQVSARLAAARSSARPGAGLIYAGIVPSNAPSHSAGTIGTAQAATSASESGGSSVAGSSAASSLQDSPQGSAQSSPAPATAASSASSGAADSAAATPTTVPAPPGAGDSGATGSTANALLLSASQSPVTGATASPVPAATDAPPRKPAANPAGAEPSSATTNTSATEDSQENVATPNTATATTAATSSGDSLVNLSLTGPTEIQFARDGRVIHGFCELKHFRSVPYGGVWLDIRHGAENQKDIKDMAHFEGIGVSFNWYLQL